MKVTRFVTGWLSTNTYVIYEDKDAYVIDPGAEDINNILKLIEKEQLELKGIILTHGHLDHIGGVKSLLKYKKDLTIYVGKEEYIYLLNPDLNLSATFHNEEFILDTKDVKIEKVSDGDIIAGLKVIETPGHTLGGITLYSEKDKIIFGGDLIFDESFGRTDFPGGNYNTLIVSIKKVLELPDDVIVYPGHYVNVKLGEYKKWFKGTIG